MAWGVGFRIAAVEVIEPFLIRFGLSKIPYYTTLRGALAGLEIGSPLLPLMALFKSIKTFMFANPIRSAFWGQVLGYIMVLVHDEWENISDKASEIWDKHGGNVSNYMVELAGTFITEYIKEATLRKTGVALELHLALPMNDEQVEIIGGDVGTWLAEIANLKLGTNFVSLYPPERIRDEVKNQIMSELTTGARNILSEADVQAFIIQLQQIRDNQLVQQFGLTIEAAKGLGLPIPPQNLQGETKAARRRAQGRARQREYRRTHTRTYGAWTVNPNPPPP